MSAIRRSRPGLAFTSRGAAIIAATLAVTAAPAALAAFSPPPATTALAFAVGTAPGAAHRPSPGVQASRIVFMEAVVADAEAAPAGAPAQPPAPSAEPLPVFRRVTDPERLARLIDWADNEPAEWALALYADAREVAATRSGLTVQPPELIVALVPGGNNAATGFRLERDGVVVDHPRVAYLKLGEDDWRFGMTLLHETGHVVLRTLAGGLEVPAEGMAAIPHTTAALTDRWTAFNEGYAIHLETLLAHLSDDPAVRERYHHRSFTFGPGTGTRSEYYRQSRDLLTYAQSFARYQEVRDNAFAFAAAYQGPDYLRVQLDRARDFATLLEPGQMLQSEGFYATFFFSLLVRDPTPGEAEIRRRQRRLVEALADALRETEATPDTPWLLRVLEAHPAPDALDVFLDLTHGVFVDADAADLWRRHYQAALRLDLENLERDAIDQARVRWRAAVEADPAVLESRLGPQLPCQVSGPTVSLVALGTEEPVYFDANTVQAGVLRLIPGINEREVVAWLAERRSRPFADAADLLARVAPGAGAREAIRCGGQLEE